MNKSMNKYKELLKEYWGYDDFRGIQTEIITSIMEGHDTLGLMPTGGGKSITFQIPALASDGTCIVVTPLIALMKDQVEHLKQLGIQAAAIYSGMTQEQVNTTLDNAVFGAYKLLYVSPERLNNNLFQTKLSHMNVSFVCIDEAHCISQWGYDFRPSYLNIRQIRSIIPHAPILALTATATPTVVKDIQKQLDFKNGKFFLMSFERKNLAYKVRKAENKERELKHLLCTRQGSTIIYCRNREHCKELAKLIRTWEHTATFYHAGLSNTEKDNRQKQWQDDKIRVMVATNAFGMGIDKPNVRLVIHMDIPDAIESYFQEAGRAGRDLLPSEAILLYDNSDITQLKKRVAENFPPKETIRQIYDEICCFLHIANGCGKGLRKEFNINIFCYNFKHHPVQTTSALNLLTKAGYIDYSDSEDCISYVMFTLNRDELYKIHSTDERKDKVMTSLLRHYNALFVHHVAIDEEFIGLDCNFTAQEVYHELRELTRLHILNYIPKKKIPHIAFTRERREKKYIIIPKEVYEDRKENMQDRIDYMIDYVTRDDICRSRFLLRYFGEKTKHDCGRCDLCIDYDKEKQYKEILLCYPPGTTIEEARRITKEEIVRQIREAGHIRPADLVVDHFDQNLVKQIIYEMSHAEEIRSDNVFKIYLTE